MMIFFFSSNSVSVIQLQLPESVTSQRLSGLQPAVPQLGAQPALHLRLEQRPVGPAADAEGTDEGHQRAEAPSASGAQSQGPLQHPERS